MLDEVRDLMRDKFHKADVGITGANFLIAETGSGVIASTKVMLIYARLMLTHTLL